MSLEAVRLREVGVFRSARQLVGFGPGLNVFAGANELGKSTVFRALRILFSEPYTANNKTVRELRPATGGAPLIECDFECAGQRWRLTKQYLAGRSAELKRLDADAVHRGGDVEAVLDDVLLTAFGTRSALPLLWVGQGDSFVPPAPDPEVRQTIEQLLRAEAEAVSGGAQLIAVHDTVRRELFGLVTEKNRRPKVGSIYADAIANRDSLRDQHQAAAEKVAASERRRQRLAEIEQEITTLNDPDRRADSSERTAALRKTLDEARQARIKADLAAERVKGLSAERTRAQQALERYDGLSKERAKIEDRRNALTSEQERSDVQLAETEAANLAAQERKNALDQRRADLHNQRLIAQRHAHRRSLKEQHTALQARIETANRLVREQQQTDELYRAIAVEEGTFRELEVMQADAAALDAQIAAIAPTMSVRYEEGRKAAFEIDGVALDDESEIVVDRPMTVTVPGLGAMTIRPASPADGDDPASQCANLRKQIEARLSALNARTIDEARAALHHRRELGAQRDAQRATLQSVAPQGTAALQQEHEDIARQIAGLGDAGDDHASLDVDQIEAEAGGLVGQIEACDAQLSELAGKLAGLRERDAARKRELAVLESRADAISAELPAAPSCDAQRQALEVALNTANDALNTATRELAAWSDVLPDISVVEEMDQQLVDLEAGQQRAQQRIADLREEMRAIGGALERDLEDGVVAAAQDIADQLDYAEARLSDLGEHVGALEMLERELASEREHQSNLVAGPVGDRLAKLAHQVLPESCFQLDQDLTVQQLQRGALHESAAQLSGGTREQISVLARLAFAGLLAENQHAVPMLLDDALVFSDDQRLDHMFQALAAAAHQHQIIILTCHARSFAPLVDRHGANRLDLTSWS